ncbi:TRAP transporter small permease subunit [bacterium SCSIO 12827]|nr:TRAP transporter small permease subunit [bacterium SCSIO 12827]
MVLAAFCFAGFLIMILAQVGYRHLDLSMVFSEDAARLLNIYAVFLGLVMVVHQDGDVRIDLIDRLLGSRPRMRAGFRVFQYLVTIVLLSAVAYGSFRLMLSNWGWILPAIRFLHQGHIYMAPFIGCVLATITAAAKLAGALGDLAGAPHTTDTTEPRT